MKKIIAVFLISVVVFTSCSKEDPEVRPAGVYYATSVRSNGPVRGFSQHGEVFGQDTIQQILSIYQSWAEETGADRRTFTELELDEDTMQVLSTHVVMKFIDVNRDEEALSYNYTTSGDWLFLQSQDTVTAGLYDSDYLRVFDSMTSYSLPDYRFIPIPTPSGFASVAKFLDKRYLRVIDDHTLGFPIVRFIYCRNYQVDNEWFELIGAEINNSLNETGYAEIGEKGLLLVKEYEIEYRRK